MYTCVCVYIYIYIYALARAQAEGGPCGIVAPVQASLLLFTRVPSPPVIPVSVKITLILREPWPCDPAAETAIQPLIWCSES